MRLNVLLQAVAQFVVLTPSEKRHARGSPSLGLIEFLELLPEAGSGCLALADFPQLVPQEHADDAQGEYSQEDGPLELPNLALVSHLVVLQAPVARQVVEDVLVLAPGTQLVTQVLEQADLLDVGDGVMHPLPLRLLEPHQSGPAPHAHHPELLVDLERDANLLQGALPLAETAAPVAPRPRARCREEPHGRRAHQREEGAPEGVQRVLRALGCPGPRSLHSACCARAASSCVSCLRILQLDSEAHEEQDCPLRIRLPSPLACVH
mmetsp:Transcript_12636/g.39470  ORF Transcript_12636/g.39470 Transcript_12636/m.39470 type:complete len:265 (-) Transcript_12636:79-873(-)